MNIRTFIKIVLVFMLMGQYILPAQAKTQDVTGLPPGMHNYTQQGMAFYDLNGVKINHDASHIFKGAKLRWGDFNNDGLDDFVMLSGDRHEYFMLRNAFNNELCIDVHNASPATGTNIKVEFCHTAPYTGYKHAQLWKYKPHGLYLASKLKPDNKWDMCIAELGTGVKHGANISLYHCTYEFGEEVEFADDGTIVGSGGNRVTAFDGLHSQSNIAYASVTRDQKQQWRKDYGNMKLRVFLNAGMLDNDNYRFDQVREFSDYYDLPFWGDFDGDGKVELLLLHKPKLGQDIKTSNTGLDQVTYVVPAYSVSIGTQPNRPRRGGTILGVADFDGDSKDDLLYFDAQDLTILPSKYSNLYEGQTIDGYPYKPSLAFQPASASLLNSSVTVGDFNNDQLADLVVQGYMSANLLVNQGDGSNFNGYVLASLLKSDPWFTNGTHWDWNKASQTKYHSGKLDGKDVLFRQEAGDMAYDEKRTLEALVFHGIKGVDANFMIRPLKQSSLDPGNFHRHMVYDYGAFLSFGDIDGDGQSDLIRSEHSPWANDTINSFSAHLHTKWDENFSLIQTGRLEHGVSVYRHNRKGTQSFSSGRIGAVNYYIWYDDNGILQYKLRQSGDDGWRSKKALPLIGKPQAIDNNSQPVDASAEMGIKTWVYNDAIYTLRFSVNNIAIIDRWNLKRTANDVTLIAAKVYQNQVMVMEKTAVLDLESNYLDAVAKFSTLLIKPSLQRAPKLHFIYAQSAEKVVDRSVSMNLDGSLPNRFETSMEFNSQVKGNEFLGAMLAEQKNEIALTANAEKETNRKTAVVTASVNVALVHENLQARFVSLYQVTHGGLIEADKNNNQLINHAKDSMQISSGSFTDVYLGMVADSHNPWGVNIIGQKPLTSDVRVLRPKEEPLDLSPQSLGYGTQNIQGMVAGTYLSASRFCNQMILLLDYKPYPFNIDCRAVELVRYGTEVNVASIEGIIEGPPPFPAENLVEFASSVSDYASITLDEKAGKQLQLTKQAGSGKITESGMHIVLAGVGGYSKASFSMNSVKEFGEMLAETTTTTIQQPPVKQNCETYNLVNETYQTRYHRWRDLQDGDATNATGYDPKCFLNNGSLLVTGSLINIYAVADKQDGIVYGFMPVPQNGAPAKYIKSFPINRNYLRVGSLDGRLGFMRLAGRKQHGDGPGVIGSAIYNRNFDSYLGLADQYLNAYQEKVKAANKSEEDKIKNAYPETKINALKNGGAMSAAYSKDVGVGKGGELDGIVEVNHNLPTEASFTFTAAAGSGATSSLIEASSRRSLSYSHAGEVISGFKHLASFSAGGLVFSGEIENSELHAGGGDSWSFQVDRDVTTTNSQEFTMYQNPLPLRSLAYGSQGAPVSSKCLGLVDEYKAHAYYLPPSAENYKHFLDNVFDYAMPNHGYEGFKRKEEPWRITYTVPHVHRLKPPTDPSICRNL